MASKTVANQSGSGSAKIDAILDKLGEDFYSRRNRFICPIVANIFNGTYSFNKSHLFGFGVAKCTNTI